MCALLPLLQWNIMLRVSRSSTNSSSWELIAPTVVAVGLLASSPVALARVDRRNRLLKIFDPVLAAAADEIQIHGHFER